MSRTPSYLRCSLFTSPSSVHHQGGGILESEVCEAEIVSLYLPMSHVSAGGPSLTHSLLGAL